MSVQKKNQSMSGSGDPNPMTVPDNEAVSTWENPMDAPGGSVSGGEVSRPRDKEASAGDVGVVPGFHGTDSSGSQGGRARFGIGPKEEDGVNGVRSDGSHDLDNDR